jgi:hypothetical protein
MPFVNNRLNIMNNPVAVVSDEDVEKYYFLKRTGIIYK